MHFFRCGIALDSWLFPIEKDVLNTGFKQSLVFSNIDTFQWPKNDEVCGEEGSNYVHTKVII